MMFLCLGVQGKGTTVAMGGRGPPWSLGASLMFPHKYSIVTPSTDIYLASKAKKGANNYPP